MTEPRGWLPNSEEGGAWNGAEAVHYLKTWPHFFELVMSGTKQFEVRKNDRDFRRGDVIVLREWNEKTNAFTGRLWPVKIGYVLLGGQFGIEAGFVVMQLDDLSAIERLLIARKLRNLCPPHDPSFPTHCSRCGEDL